MLRAHSDIESEHDIALVDDASSPEGTRWAVGTAASASAVLSYFVLTHVTGVTNITVRLLAAERPARPPAKRAGSPSQRTKVISAAP
jgi:hypothetical protein